jgi:sugar lactone lactonase YvrE
MVKLLYLLYLIKTSICGCQPDHRRNDFDKARSHYKIRKTGTLNAKADESSGLARVFNKNTYWTHNDSGGANELYEINSKGDLISTLSIPDSKNRDWEDLSQSPEGALYIGDIGNNSNTRRDLTIYKYDLVTTQTGKITFHYADQTDFPPTAEKKNFDCEAFFYFRDHLYLFSKNRSETNKYVRLYRLPALPGDYSIAPQDSIYISEQVTGADVSPDGKTFTLLSYGKVFLFSIDSDKIDFSRPKACIPFVKKQTEAIIFLNNTDMLVTNEQKEMFTLKLR